MLFLGGVSDKIGVRKALVLSFLMFAVGRVLIALAGTLSLGHGIGSPMFFLTCIGLLIMVVAYGLYQPAAYAGVKRYTTPQTAAMGYAVIYLLHLRADPGADAVHVQLADPAAVPRARLRRRHRQRQVRVLLEPEPDPDLRRRADGRRHHAAEEGLQHDDRRHLRDGRAGLPPGDGHQHLHPAGLTCWS
jgi:hypothetical protein